MVWDDIIVCADLFRQRLEKVQDGFALNENEWDAELVHDTLDALNTILAVMESNMLKGLSNKDFKEFVKTLESFIGSID